MREAKKPVKKKIEACKGRKCSFCGGLLDKQSCRRQRQLLSDPKTRKQALAEVTGLVDKVIRTKSVREIFNGR